MFPSGFVLFCLLYYMKTSEAGRKLGWVWKPAWIFYREKIISMRICQISRRMSGSVSTFCRQPWGLLLILAEANSLPNNHYGLYTFTFSHSTCPVIWSSLMRLLEYASDHKCPPVFMPGNCPCPCLLQVLNTVRKSNHTYSSLNVQRKYFQNFPVLLPSLCHLYLIEKLQ